MVEALRKGLAKNAGRTQANANSRSRSPKRAVAANSNSQSPKRGAAAAEVEIGRAATRAPRRPMVTQPAAKKFPYEFCDA